MTLCSFIDLPPPTPPPGAACTPICTTVSTSWPAITLAITGFRMSARTNETGPRSDRGGTTSTPMTRDTAGSAAIRRAKRPPTSRDTPVTSTTRPTPGPLSCAVTTVRLAAGPRPAGRPSGLLALTATLDARLLEQLAVLLLGHALAALLDNRTHRWTFHIDTDERRRPERPVEPAGRGDELTNKGSA